MDFTEVITEFETKLSEPLTPGLDDPNMKNGSNSRFLYNETTTTGEVWESEGRR